MDSVLRVQYDVRAQEFALSYASPLPFSFNFEFMCHQKQLELVSVAPSLSLEQPGKVKT